VQFTRLAGLHGLWRDGNVTGGQAFAGPFGFFGLKLGNILVALG